MNKKITISIILVIIWLVVIFTFSAMDAVKSNLQSKGVINKVVEKVEATNEGNNQVIDKNKTVNKLNKPVRKFAHASVYFVLSILVMFFIYALKRKFEVKYVIFNILFCFLYACTDEFHQIFVNGRSAQFTDVLIDTCGAIFGVLCVFMVNTIHNKIKINKKRVANASKN